MAVTMSNRGKGDHQESVTSEILRNLYPLDQSENEENQYGRGLALSEARQCLESIKMHGFQLDGFNLLGVVANPRAGGGASSTSSSRHSLSAQTNNRTAPSSALGDSATIKHAMLSPPQSTTPDPCDLPNQHPDLFADTVQTLEITLSQVTEQIENLNLFLEELSRQYLGDDLGESVFLEYYLQHEQEQAEVSPIPPQLANLQLNSLQAYLEECGILAHSLFARPQTLSSLREGMGFGGALGYRDPSEENFRSQLPEALKRPEFALTDPKTFLQLLMEEDSLSWSASSPNALYQPTHQLVPLASPESLSSHLDKVELALQDQVRQKAGAFFQETTRISQLKVGIVGILHQVQTVRSGVRQILTSYSHVADMSMLDHRRQDYLEMMHVVDSTTELIRCKSSIGGLVSANDHLGAAEQIQFGRRLLKGSTAPQAEFSVDTAAELIQLTALSASTDQFKEYESLVVHSLSEQLVEVFLGWKTGRMEDLVTPTVQALELCNALPATGQLYVRRLQQVIRMTVRTTIAEFVDHGGVTGMTYAAFSSCLAMLLEELQHALETARAVDQFCSSRYILHFISKEGSKGNQPSRWTSEAVTCGAELASKSVAELLRLRKEAHSLITLEEMKQLWDTCLQFTLRIEDLCETRAVGLRSTLWGQAKSFLERTHESNMAALVAALDSERWTQCEISGDRQAVLTRLCSGRAFLSAPPRHAAEDRNAHDPSTKSVVDRASGTQSHTSEKRPTAEVEGIGYKVVWSCLLLVEMLVANLSSASYFQSLAANAVAKVSELLRLFNARTTHLVLGAGAIHSAARLKSINAKHLSLVTQCLGMILAIFPHVRAALMAQLPPKQHTLLKDLDQIKRDYSDHNEKVLNKFVTIIGGIVEHGLAPRIANADFDARAQDAPASEMKRGGEDVACCIFLDGVVSNTRKMHQVLRSLLPPDHLQDVFSRIFAYVDQKVPALLISYATDCRTIPGSNGANPTLASPQGFRFPETENGKRQLLREVEFMIRSLNALQGVQPWDFTAITVLERKMDFNYGA